MILATILLATCVGCQEHTADLAATPMVSPASAFVEFSQDIPRSVPLQRNSRRHRTATRFELTSPDETGLTFVHEWNPPPDQVDRLNSYAIGAGVAIGDIDADGLPEVFLSCQSKGGRLFRNLGGFHFEDITVKCGMAGALAGVWATGCTFVDIDGDNDLDLYVCAYNDNNLLFINRGDGSFVEQAANLGLDYRGASVMIAFSDYDGDGDLDAYLLTNHLRPRAEDKFRIAIQGGRPTVPEEFRQFRDILVPPPGHGAPKLIEGAQYDFLYRNDGDATFTDVTLESGIGRHNYHGLAAIWWDCNSDGLPDLYVANDFFGPDQLYVNNGDGTFTDRVKEFLPHVPWFSMGADSADINNDGLFDFLATDMSSTSAERAHLTMGELAADAWFLDFAKPRQYMRNSLYLNSGADRFMEIAHMAGVASTNWTWTAKFADLDGDGWVDLFVTNGMTRDFQNSDLKDESRRAARTAASTFEFWKRQAQLRETNLVYRNAKDYHFEETGCAWGLDHRGISTGAAYGDLDNDGDLDVVVNNFGEQTSVYRNHTQDQHFVKIRLLGEKANPYGIDSVVRIRAGGELQSRYVTLSRGFMSSDDPIVHFGVGPESHLDSLEVRWRDGSTQSYRDLPADRLYSVSKAAGKVRRDDGRDVRSRMFVRVPIEPPILHREREFNDFARQPLLPSRRSKRGPGLAYGDVNGDGHCDLYLCGAAGQSGQLFLGTSTGFEPTELFADSLMIFDYPSSDAEEMGAVFFDLEGDGDLDLYVVAGGVECEPSDPKLRDRLLINQGNGKFLPAPPERLPASVESGTCVCAADFDRDADLDLFVGGGSIPGEYPRAAKSCLLVNDAGRLVEQSSAVAPEISQLGIVSSALWSDIDNDGWIDLLVAQEWGNIAVYKNERGTLVDRTSQSGLSQRRGWWNGIAGRDLDNDGDVDYVVTNYGLNTKYRASFASPAILLYGDFDGTGRRHIVEAAVRKSTLVPVRGKQALEVAMPMMEAKFPRFSEYASCTLADIYGKQALGRASRLEANTLESGVLWNNGQGKFEFAALPRFAQVSPSFGVQLSDFNCDGRCDVLMVQNFFSPQREIGRMDGGLGLLLLGEDGGTLRPIWPDSSGIVIPDDAKSLLVGDVNDDQRPDFVVGVNNSELQVYENQGTGPGKPFAVCLSNCPGNPTAIGARIQVHTEDGTLQTAEVTAGGSYLAQSSGKVFFGVDGSHRVSMVSVRWPDGRETSHIPENQTELTISYPSSGTEGIGRGTKPTTLQSEASAEL